jgi:AraC family carnitine catabolism transcriptional activator
MARKDGSSEPFKGVDEPRRIALVCLEPSLHGALLSIEPFRAANRLSRAPLFKVDFISVDGQPTRSIMDIAIPTTATLHSATIYDLVLLYCAYEFGGKKSALFRWLHRQSAAGAHICALDTAPLLLAAAGLLKGFKATSHWSALASFRELYPDTEVVEQVFVVDRNRATCAGQIACLDYSLFMLERFCGRALREVVANDLIYPIARGEDAQQRQIINGHAWHTNPILARAQTLMQSSIEEPLSIAKIAVACGISQRELEHLFQKYLKASPKSYYTTFRLQRARELLLYSALSVRETGLACGFVSPTTYFRAFRSRFKVSPLSYRKAFQGAPSSPDGRRLY